MKKIEIILGTLSIIVLGLNLFLLPGSGALTVLTLSTLSVFYMYFSFALFNDIRPSAIFKKGTYKEISTMRIAGAVGTGFALSVTIAGFLFKVQSWPGANFNIGAGLFGVLIASIVGLTKYSKNKSDYYIKIFKRAAIYGGLGIMLVLTPKTAWVELKYRNHPDYLDALKKSFADPDNQKLRDKVDEERQKMKNEQE